MMIFILSGCARQEYEVVINESNNVDFTIRVLISKESYNLLSTFGVDLTEIEKNKVSGTGSEIDTINALFQETAAHLQKYGFKVSSADDAVEIGFIAKKTYLTVEEFNAEIIELCNNDLSGLNLEITYEEKGKSKRYTAYGTLDYVVDADMGFSDTDIKGYFDEQYQNTSAMTASVKIETPISIPVTAHDGIVGQQGISWETSYNGEQKEVHIIAEYKDNTMTYVIIFVVVVALAVGSIFVLRILKQKKEIQASATRDLDS